MPYQLSEHSSGVTDNITGALNPANYTRTPAATPSSGGFSFGNLAHSIGDAAVGAGKFIGHAFIDPIATSVKAIGQGLPGVGSVDRNFTDYNQRGHVLDAQLDSAMKAYRSKDPKVKISKDELNSRVQSINAANAQLSLENQKNAESLVKPQDAAQALAETGLMFTGFGELKAASEGSKLLKLSRALESGYNAIPGLGIKAAEVGAKAPGILSTLAKGAVKYPLVTKPNIEFPGQILNDIKTGNYKDIGTQAAFIGGGHALLAAPKALSAVERATFGEKGVLSEVFGSRIQQFLKEHPEHLGVAKQMQQFTLNHVGGSVKDGANFLAKHLTDEVHINPKSADLTTELNRAKNFFNERERLQGKVAEAAKNGIKLPQNPVISHAVGDYKGKFKYAVDQQIRDKGLDITNPAHRQQIADSILNDPSHRLSSIKDETLKGKLSDALLNSNTKAELRQNLAGITSKNPINIPGFRPGKGFQVVTGPKTVTAVPSLSASGDLKFSRDANPVLGKVGDVLTKAGLSPLDQGSRTTQGLVKDNFMKNLGDSFSSKESSSDIYNKVMETSGVSRKLANFDPRTLTLTELKNGLGSQYSRGEAKQVFKAMTKAYADLPVAQVGIGPKVVNKALQAIPAEGKYLRIQGAGKFSLNPFFYGKQVVKSGLISAAEGGNLFKRPSRETASFLEQHQFFNKNLRDAGIADYLESDISKSADKIGAVQQHIMGSLAQTIADQHGKSLDQIWSEGGALKNQIEHALTVTVGYPKGTYLSSPLAKTLNVLIFPSRFETKVAMEAGKWMARQTPITRVALFHDMANLKQQLDSPEGQKWQSKNSEAIGLLQYFTPLKTVGDLMKGLGEKNISDLGEIGGLPFGVIKTILEHQGVIKQAPYQSPKTGAISADTLPVTTKGRVQQVLTDLISSTFGYPGRQAGFDLSKTQLVQKIPGLTPGKGDFTKVDRTGDASAEQKAYQAAVGTGAVSAGKLAPGENFVGARSSFPAVPKPNIVPIASSRSARGARPAKVKRFARPIPRF